MVQKCSHHCMCGPHPVIDLTAAYRSYSHSCRGGVDIRGKDNSTSIAVSCEQVLDAAWSHGCFRISIRIDGDNDNNNGTNDRKGMRSLTKSVKSIEHDVESLFSSSFLRRAQAIGGTVANDATNKDDVRNGGMFAVPLPVSSSSSLLPQSTVTTTATFWGRVAESGNTDHPVPEPKLSWEYR